MSRGVWNTGGECALEGESFYCMVGIQHVDKKHLVGEEPNTTYNPTHAVQVGLVTCCHGLIYGDAAGLETGDTVRWYDGAGPVHKYKAILPAIRQHSEDVGNAVGPFSLADNGIGVRLNIGETLRIDEVFDDGVPYWIVYRNGQKFSQACWATVCSPTEGWTQSYALNADDMGSVVNSSFTSAGSDRPLWAGNNGEYQGSRYTAGPHCLIAWNGWTTSSYPTTTDPGQLRYALFPTDITGGTEQTFIPHDHTHHVQTDIAVSVAAGRIVFAEPMTRFAPLCLGYHATVSGGQFDVDVYLVDWRDPTTYWAPVDMGSEATGFATAPNGSYAAKGWRTDNPEIVGGRPLFSLTGIDYGDLESLIADSHMRDGRIVVLLNDGRYFDSLHQAVLDTHDDDTGDYLPAAIHIGTDGEVLTLCRKRFRRYDAGVSTFVLTANEVDVPPGGAFRRVGIRITSNAGGYCLSGFESHAESTATAFTRDLTDEVAEQGAADPYIGALYLDEEVEWMHKAEDTFRMSDYALAGPLSPGLDPAGVIAVFNEDAVPPFSHCYFPDAISGGTCPNGDYSEDGPEIRARPWTSARYNLSMRFKGSPFDYWIVSKDGSQVSPLRAMSKELTTITDLDQGTHYAVWAPFDTHFIDPGEDGRSITIDTYSPYATRADMSELAVCPLTAF